MAFCQPPQPWKNGGGTTRELLAWPAAADWRVRLSVAEVAADGPFSRFEGVQRWFAVLRGAGVRLVVDGVAHTLTAASEPLAFDGAADTQCTLLGRRHAGLQPHAARRQCAACSACGASCKWHRDAIPI
jgi:environmental stress-induced protein Ves